MRTALRALMLSLPLALLLVATGAAGASAERRLALVIGNGAYRHIGALANPTEDARLMAASLERTGFETTLALDVGQDEMKRHIASFGRALRIAGSDAVGLFYFAGHGIQASGRNYLIPVEANPTDAADLDLMGVEADWVLRQMESAQAKANIVILDACRNNPFSANNRAVNRGLAAVFAPTGSFIAYATAPGDVALDGNGRNSPFTEALAEQILVPNQSIETLFKQVRLQVIQETEGRQTPWDSSSLVTDFVFNRAAVVEAPDPAELSLWESVRTARDPSTLAVFLQLYPNGRFAAEARRMLAEAIAARNGAVGDAAPRATAGTGAATAPPAAIAAAPAAGPAAPAPVAAAPAKTAAAPAESEEAMMARAQGSRSADDYRAYLAAYPNGVFRDLAVAEIDALEKDAAVDRDTPKAAGPGTTQVATATPGPADTPRTDGGVYFNRPLPDPPEGAAGLSIEQLAQGSPRFPPFEGIPDSYWKGQKCSNCHHWTREALCTQGNFYVGKDPATTIGRLKHPYGGAFRRGLLAWALAGCP